MNILLTNDDGIFAEGIFELAKELEKEHNVVIIAPHIENSAKSQAITIYENLDVEKVEIKGLKSDTYSVTGTPADCVRIAVGKIVDCNDIDLVMSGINKGLNVGMDVLYSGTVSAAIEGCIQGLPSIAVSAEYKNGDCDFSKTAKYAANLLNELILNNEIDRKLVLNFNVPRMEEDIKGIKVCKLGEKVKDFYRLDEEKENNDIFKSYRIKGREEKIFKENTDRFYVEHGYATLTPIRYNLTHEDLMDRFSKYEK